MSDFPRGWTLTANPAGGTAISLTVPAVAGVVHVLDSFDFRIVQEVAGAAAGTTLTLTSSDGVFASLALAFLLASGTVGGIDSASASGLDLAAGPGASLTLAAPAVTTSQMFLLIQGHDI